MTRTNSVFFLCVLVLCVFVAIETVSGQVLIVSSFLPLTGKDARDGAIQEAMVRKAIIYFNNRSREFFPNNYFYATINSVDTASTVDGALASAKDFTLTTFTLSGQFRDVAEAIAPVVEQSDTIHYTSCSSQLLTPYNTIAQLVPSERHQGVALAELIVRFNWQYSVASLSSSSSYGSEILSSFISRCLQLDINVLSSQQFYPGTQALWEVMQTTKNSLARVIVNIMDVKDMKTVIRFADRLDMLTSKYVWICSDACATEDIFRDEETNKIDARLRDKLVGLLGVQYQTGQGKMYEEFLDEWEKDDQFLYPGSGQRSTSHFAAYAYDAVLMYLHALSYSVANFPGVAKSVNLVLGNQAKVSFMGMTGFVKMDETGRERLATFDIVNLRSDSLKAGYQGLVVIGKWNETRALASSVDVDDLSKRFEFEYKPQFHGGSYDYPDLDIRNSYQYWSCQAGEEKTDKTGKSIRLEKPDGGSADNIDIDYRCDQFIDCYNMSDEWGCDVSFPVLFIVYGIFLFICICLAVFCLIFTCVFGYCIKRKRVRASSPTFLIILCLAAITGYGGLFAFFGQPHTVSCNFRIWLLALAVITAISALFTKSFRVWRLYRSPTEIKALQDWQLVLFVIASVVPVFVLLALWTGLATPMAILSEASKDHREHLQCGYGSVAGEIGFYFFFFAIVAYVGLFLLFGVFLSIATRNVVSTFNESRLIAISIYNITFSSIVTIPIVFVLKDSDPLITWIIIVTAFAYGFTATLVLQFFPKVWGIVVRDKFLNDASTQSGHSSDQKNSSGISSDSKAIF